MVLILLLILFGIFGGVLAGLLGIGGGIIYVLILPRALAEAGIPENLIVQFTIANSLFGIVFASLTTNLLNISRKDFYLSKSLMVALPGTFASLLVLNFIVNTEWYNRLYFNGLLILFLLYMLVSGIRNFKKKLTEKEPVLHWGTYPFAGVSGGILSALTGLGGGAVVVPILTTQLNMNIKKARSISLAMIFITSLILTLFNLFQSISVENVSWQMGYIFFPVAIPLTAGVLIGSPIGSKLGSILSSNKISFIFGLLLMVVILEKCFQLYHSL